MYTVVYWLQHYAYLATWLALPVTLLAGFLQAKKANFTGVSWFRLLIYFTFVTCLAVAFTPTFDNEARSVARSLIFMLLGVIIVSRFDDRLIK
jgi:hypothetical protein